MVADSETQRIAKLSPLANVLASFDLSVAPVMPRDEAVRSAIGRTIAADVTIPAAHPAQALALRDGYALRSEQTADASSYAPARLSPASERIDVGDPLPAGMDAVAALDAVQNGQALATVAPGDGVLPPGADATAGLKLILTGTRLRRIDVAALLSLGIERVPIREPRVRIVRTGPGAVIDAAATMIARAIDVESGSSVDSDVALEPTLRDETVDAIVAIGGTGSGRNDASVRTLARIGEVAFHGIAIAPGETTALGFVEHRPVLLLPGRLDAAIAGWLTVGRRMLARLAFRLVEEQPFSAELARKISSPLGYAEVIPVRRRAGKVEPVASGYLSIQALVRAEGWILVPADSEGHPEGTRVVVRPWP